MKVWHHNSNSSKNKSCFCYLECSIRFFFHFFSTQKASYDPLTSPDSFISSKKSLSIVHQTHIICFQAPDKDIISLSFSHHWLNWYILRFFIELFCILKKGLKNKKSVFIFRYLVGLYKIIVLYMKFKCQKQCFQFGLL